MMIYMSYCDLHVIKFHNTIYPRGLHNLEAYIQISPRFIDNHWVYIDFIIMCAFVTNIQLQGQKVTTHPFQKS